MTRTAALQERSAEPSGATYTKLSPGPGKKAAEVRAHQCARIHGAMVELSADRGYQSVTIRALAKRAGVSTRALYTHFSDKEACFFSAYEQVVRRAAKRIVHAQAGEPDWRERLRLAFGAFVEELERDTGAARVALIEIYAVGPKAFAYVQRTESMFEAMLEESFSRASAGLPMPSSLIRGIVAGTTRVARARVLDGSCRSLPGLGDELTDWALSYHSDAVVLLPELDRGTPNWESAPETPIALSDGLNGLPALDGERALILSATARLAAEGGYAELTVPDICAAAGVSRKVFDTHFTEVEDCFVAAVQREASQAFDRTTLAESVSSSEEQVSAERWAKTIHQMVLDFCSQLGTSSNFARLCLGSFSTPASATINCAERLLEQVESNLHALAKSPVDRDDLRLQASAGAAWGALCHQLTLNSRPGPQASLDVGSLSFLATAPLVGPKMATAAIRDATLRAKAQTAHSTAETGASAPR